MHGIKFRVFDKSINHTTQFRALSVHARSWKSSIKWALQTKQLRKVRWYAASLASSTGDGHDSDRNAKYHQVSVYSHPGVVQNRRDSGAVFEETRRGYRSSV
jgi:hypothetical protein